MRRKRREDFDIVKLADYRQRETELFKSKNPFAHFVLAFLKTQDTRKDDLARKAWKFELMKNLYRVGFSKARIEALYRFIDWIMLLPDNLETTFFQEVAALEEERQMKYVTSAERIGREIGRKETLRQHVLEVLSERFGKVPSPIKKAVQNLDDLTRLNLLFKRAITIDSLKNFPVK